MKEILYKIADFDEKILVLHKRLDPYHVRRAALKNEVDAARREDSKVSVNLLNEKRAMRSFEVDLKTVEDRMTAETKKIDLIQSIKAAQAADHELAGLRAKQSDLEGRILELMETVEKFEQQQKGILGDLTAKEEELAKLDAELAASGSGITEQVSTLSTEKDALVGLLDAEYRKKYIALAAAHIVRPITRADAGSCMGCRSALKPNVSSRLRADMPAVCDHCKRILLPN